jgi:L,D-transpeptidase YcbB
MTSVRRHATLVALALGVSLGAPAHAIEPDAQPTPPAPVAEPVTAPVTEAAPAPQASPLLMRVQEQLAQKARKSVDTQDLAALNAYYAEPTRPLVWITQTGLTPAADAVIAEIRKAADWGLTPGSFDISLALNTDVTPDALAAAEVRIALAVLKYARHARGGRIDVGLLGRNIDQKPPLLEPKAVLDGIAAAPDASAYLRGLHPRHPQFEKLRQALLAARRPAAISPATAPAPGADVKLPAGPRIKAGQSHAHVALLRQRLGVVESEGPLDRFDAPLQAALRAFQQEKGLDDDGTLNNSTRTALNGGVKPAAAGDQAQRILVNMERWRWLPADLGRFHVWDNIPEYRMRVLKDGKTVHAETIIVGKPSTPTPVFSADMKFVIFHPTWGVPDGIKMNELAPSLRRSSNFWGGSDPSILRRHNLMVSYNGRPVDPSSVDWERADIRNFQFTQPPSSSNVLGVVKFRFPNKHDVYMHDTPERELFSRADKAFSHGCMRVQNPRRLAEVLLAEDKGWSSSQVGHAIANGATHEVSLSKQIPVHVTYFTAVVDDDGHVKTFADIYGHDSRIASALEGKPIRLIAQTDPAVRAEREVRRTASRRPPPSRGNGSIFDVFSGLVGN